MEPYCSYHPNAYLLLPETEHVAGRLLTLPTGTAVGPCEIRTITSIIRAACTDPTYVRYHLNRRSSLRPLATDPLPVAMGPRGIEVVEPAVRDKRWVGIAE